jgi:hypothetical protein
MTVREPASTAGPRLVDVLDRLLDRGVVLRGELWLTVADVELVFIGAHLTLATPDRMRRGACPLQEPADA